ncbi:MAG TPA: hypothetical protein VG204_14455 [Terriglobia bacterium]|nr:hypothetical protein [Terriglobia bacterium]
MRYVVPATLVSAMHNVAPVAGSGPEVRRHATLTPTGLDSATTLRDSPHAAEPFDRVRDDALPADIQ